MGVVSGVNLMMWVLVVGMVMLGTCSRGLVEGQLQVGFYRQSCRDAEPIISSVVRNRVLSDINLAAILLRLHFHDCFVEGCDGSILVDNGEVSERRAFGHQGVGGFDVIEQAKAQLEAACPGTVSCADIVALAARDAIVMANGPRYEVPTGRRDGRVSNLSLASNMPDVADSIEQLKSKFARQGLSEKDLVLLSAAHTIGTTACFFMMRRLYDFPPGQGSDPSINPGFLPLLKSRCPREGQGVNEIRIAMDEGSDRLFDKQILQNIRNGFAVLESDAKLNDDPVTRNVIDSYLSFFAPLSGVSFEADFVKAIVKMGQIGVKTGSSGEIRRVCSSFN